MENKTRQQAKEQLSLLGEVAHSTKVAAYPLSPRWYSLVIACFGPLVVLFETQSGLAMVGAAFAMLVLLAGLGYHDWKRRKVRSVRSRPNTRTTLAMAALIYPTIMCLMLTGVAARRYEPVLVALGSFVLLGMWFIVVGSRAEKTIRSQATGRP